jgi:hypothetical protein
MYLSLAFLVTGGMVGAPWDRMWHWSNTFDSFLSPPHVFMYCMGLLSLATAATVGLSPRLAPLFGPGRLFPVINRRVPNPFIILTGGLFALLLAGALDSQWHAVYGVDETSWSTPHALLWWGFFLSILGHLACRNALGAHLPLSAPERVLFGWLVLLASVTIIVGTFAHNKTPATVAAIAALPTFQDQPAAQHLFRIYGQWHIDQTNPLFAPLAAMAAGFGLALVRGVAGNPRLFLAVAGLATLTTAAYEFWIASLLGVSGSPSTWLPLPFLPAAVAVLVLERARIAPPVPMVGAGIVFGTACALVWIGGPFAALAAAACAPAMVVGDRAGAWVSGVVGRPTPHDLRPRVSAWALLAPLITGTLDIYLRTLTA